MNYLDPKEAPVYSNYKGDYTRKGQSVYCDICKYWTTTDLLGAKCGNCNSNLITIMKPLQDEKLVG